jgi:hypothetical protein
MKTKRMNQSGRYPVRHPTDEFISCFVCLFLVLVFDSYIGFSNIFINHDLVPLTAILIIISPFIFFYETHINITHRYVNYTIFNDEKRDIQILQGFSGETKTINFNRMPDCAVNTLLNYVDKKSLSNDVSKKSVDWMMNDKLTYVVCENAFFVEKYALGVLNFAAPIKASDDSGGLWIRNDERRCMWPSITCERGSVVRLGLDSSELSGKIAPEISLLTNLVEYIPCRFHEHVFYTDNLSRLSESFASFTDTCPLFGCYLTFVPFK